MSKRHNDTIAKMVTAMIMEEMLKHKEDKKECEAPPTKTKGFDSLVSEEEFEAIANLAEAMSNYIDVHNKCNLDNFKKGVDPSDYALVQYTLLNHLIYDAQDTIGKMFTIHTCDKEVIDDLAEDRDTTIEGLYQDLATKLLFRKLAD